MAKSVSYLAASVLIWTHQHILTNDYINITDRSQSFDFSGMTQQKKISVRSSGLLEDFNVENNQSYIL